MNFDLTREEYVKHMDDAIASEEDAGVRADLEVEKARILDRDYAVEIPPHMDAASL